MLPGILKGNAIRTARKGTGADGVEDGIGRNRGAFCGISTATAGMPGFREQSIAVQQYLRGCEIAKGLM